MNIKAYEKTFMKTRTNIFLGIGIGTIIVIGGWLIFSGLVERAISQEKIKTSQERVSQEVILIIDDGKGSLQVFEVDAAY